MSSVFELLGNLSYKDLTHFSDAQLKTITAQILEAQQNDRKENQLLYYNPVSTTACRIHESQARFLGVGGGNGASKTDTLLAELVMHATGIYPRSLPERTRGALLAKFRGPVAVRVVVESLTTTLHPVILPKMQWWKWSGTDSPGGERGHYGWVPRSSLKGGQWVTAWSEKLRELKVLCKDPETEEVLGESTFQFMAHTQDPSDFASGDFHHILHDELTSWPIWRENEARTMRVGGRMLMAMTWPDDPSIPVDWVFDEVYEAGLVGPNKDPNTDWFEMWSKDNPNLNQETVAQQEQKWSKEVAAVRIYGRPIRFSNRVHPLFTDHDTLGCSICGSHGLSVEYCEVCKTNAGIVVYNHVQDFDSEPSLPTVFLLDPHPRKPHMGLWAQVDTWDDLWIVEECLVEGGPDDLQEKVGEVERIYGFKMVDRIGDPNMLGSPSGAVRGVLWRDEFDAVGLRINNGDTSDVGRSRINDFLRIDPDRGRPRIHIHSRCVNTVRQMNRYVWDDYRHVDDRGQKQKAKDKDDDFPTLLKYLMNYNPRYGMLQYGGGVIKTRGAKRGRSN
jgi:hypothetical protein